MHRLYSEGIFATGQLSLCFSKQTDFTSKHLLTSLSVCLFQVDYAVIASQAGATLNNLLSHAQELVAKLRSLQLDQREFVCLKFLVLFSLGESLKP